MASGKGRQLAQCTLSIQIILAGEFYFYCKFFFSKPNMYFEKATKICSFLSQNKLNGRFRSISMSFSEYIGFE